MISSSPKVLSTDELCHHVKSGVVVISQVHPTLASKERKARTVMLKARNSAAAMMTKEIGTAESQEGFGAS